MTRAKQQDLFGGTDPLEAAFTEFHRANPQVFEEIRRRVRRLLEKGITRIGIATVYESMRYDYMLATSGDSYRLNNSYRAYYARLLRKVDPELGRAVVCRESRADWMMPT